jgi:hypothetical protein
MCKNGFAGGEEVGGKKNTLHAYSLKLHGYSFK